MKVEILVPKSLSEITLGKYMRYAKLETKENKDTTFLMQKCVEIFCELDLQNIATIRYKSLLKVIEHINTLFNGKYEFKNKFKMNGVEYGFIPVLDDISMGEYIDLDNYFSDWDNMHKAMSVLYRPVTHSKDDRYDIEPYNGTERSEEYKNMPMDVVMGSFIFFYHLSKELLETTLNCLEKDQEANWISLAHSEGSGAGIKAYMHSLKGMLQDLNISLN